MTEQQVEVEEDQHLEIETLQHLEIEELHHIQVEQLQLQGETEPEEMEMHHLVVNGVGQSTILSHCRDTVVLSIMN